MARAKKTAEEKKITKPKSSRRISTKEDDAATLLETPAKETKPKKKVVNDEKTNFPEPKKPESAEVVDKDGKVIEVDNTSPITPAEYFDKVKSKMTDETPENIAALYDATMNKLKRYMITGQKVAAKDLYARCVYLERELQLIDRGVTKYVLRTDIDKYIDDIADECVCVIEMRNFDRPIPDDIIDVVAETMDIFDEFYVVFTDYTGEKRSKVAKERRDKDPILFGNIFIDGKLSPKMYFIGDWVDEYCDLTLDKMIEAIAKEEKKDEKDIVYDIADPSILDNIEEELFGTTKRVTSRTTKQKV